MAFGLLNSSYGRRIIFAKQSAAHFPGVKTDGRHIQEIA
jgi:hypothetical protein